ncbi:hypothetical protein K3495_g1818 [Podosphaera aphanis]|nr:hypothetical protein K3495_g1818 [Podosphaera aphanis]
MCYSGPISKPGDLLVHKVKEVQNWPQDLWNKCHELVTIQSRDLKPINHLLKLTELMLELNSKTEKVSGDKNKA